MFILLGLYKSYSLLAIKQNKKRRFDTELVKKVTMYFISQVMRDYGSSGRINHLMLMIGISFLITILILVEYHQGLKVNDKLDLWDS